MQIFHNPRIERKISFPKFSILFSSKDTNNHHIQLQIYTSTERIKKKKNFLPIPIDSQIVRSKNEEANNRSAFSAEGTRKMSKRGRLSFLERNRLIGTDGFRDHEGAGTQNRFLHDRSINHPLLRNANAKYTGWDSAVRATGSHMCSCIVA